MSIYRTQWSDKAEAGLFVSMGDDAELIKQEVQRGISALWRCESETNAGYVVTRFEPESNELVLVCGEGSGFKEFAPEFVKAARTRGASIRVHVKRRGMIRLFQQCGVTLDEYVLRG